MKFWRISIVLLSLFVLLFAGCATTPEEDPEQETEEIVEEPEPEPEVEEEAPLPDAERDHALDLRMRIAEEGIADEDPENMQLADTAFAEAEELYESDNITAREKYNDAIDGYYAVIRTAFADQSEELKQEVRDVRSQADEAFAEKAASEPYETGVEAWNTAESHATAGDYDLAYAAFQDADRAFSEARDVAQERRENARAALERSRERIQQSEQQIRERQEEVSSEVEENEAASEAERELADEIEEDEE